MADGHRRFGARTASALVGVVLCAVILGLAGRQVLSDALDRRVEQRGIAYGTPPEIVPPRSYPLGVNTSLEQYGSEESLQRALDLIEQAGFRWVRQPFYWSEIEPNPGEYHWDSWDRIVRLADARGLEIIAVLRGSPAWARAPGDKGAAEAPPKDLSAYGRFAGAVASRYDISIDYYQIWDHPNIYPFWGNRDVDPASYVSMLGDAWSQIKAHDTRSYILSATLAPNVESGGPNLNELDYLREMYRAGAARYCDIVGASSYGFWSGPEDRRVSRDVLNLSRLILLREELVRLGDDSKPIWAVEFGWNALPEGWTGRPSPWGTDSELKQADRALRALDRVWEEWPWIGLVCFQHLQPNVEMDDPVWGYALIDSGGTPRMLHPLLQERASARPLAYPGYYAATSAFVERSEGWDESSGYLAAASCPASLNLAFWGTRLDLDVQGRSGVLRAWLTDGGSQSRPTEIDLSRLSGSTSWVAGAKDLEARRHQLRVEVESCEDGDEIVLRRFAVVRDLKLGSYHVRLGFLVALMAASVLIGVHIAKRLPLAEWWGLLSRWYLGRSEVTQWLLAGLAMLLYYLAPWMPASLLGLAVVVGIFCLRHDVALAAIVASAPLAVFGKPIGQLRVTVVEALTLSAFVAWFCGGARGVTEAARGAWRAGAAGVKTLCGRAIAALSSMDWAVALFVAAGVVSLAASANLEVSLRELRTVIMEPALFYFLVRTGRLKRGTLIRVIDALVVVGLLLSLQGLYQYAFTDDVIAAEGVRRIRGIYGSPNNMGLLLVRILPVAAAMALKGRRRWRRWTYGLAAVPMSLCLFLTYSRGALLLGVPATLVALGLLMGRRAWVVVLVVVIAVGVSFLPLLGTERFTSTFSLQEGTGFLRVRLWESALKMIRDYPLTGVGLDNFLYHYPDYILPGAEVEPNLSHPHNIVLDFWTRLGVLGVAALVWLLVSFFRHGRRLYRHNTSGDTRAMVGGAIAGVAGSLAHGMIDNAYFLVELAFVFVLFYAIVARLESDMGTRDVGAGQGTLEQL